MIKYKITKYIIILISILIFVTFAFLLRLAYKPIDVSYLKKKIPEINYLFKEIDTKNIILDFNIFKNHLELKFIDPKIKSFLEQISNIMATEIKVSIKITNFLKKDLKSSKLFINKGTFDLNQVSILKSNNLLDNTKVIEKLPFKSISFKNTNINVYDQEFKLGEFNNINGNFENNFNKILLKDINIESISLHKNQN